MFDLDSPAGERLRDEQILWLTTVRADGQPQTSPVWFVWEGESLLVFSQPDAQKLRNLAANPRVSVHLDADGRDAEVVNLEGTTTVDPDAPSPVSWRPTRPSTGRASGRSGRPPRSRRGTTRWRSASSLSRCVPGSDA